MKNLTLMFAAFVLVSSTESFAAGMHDKTPTELQQLWSTNQQKCKQGIDKTRELLAPSDSKRRALSDTLRGAVGKDTKEGKKEDAMKKLNDYEMQQQAASSSITSSLTALIGSKSTDATAIGSIEKQIMDHSMACDGKTAELAKAVS
jgi:hypothetical protein